jgi:rhodanese-related sulfurtransferase
MCAMVRPSARPALLFASAVATLSCVVWPAGSGPGAAEVPVGEALARFDSGEAVLIDVRSPVDYAEGHIPGAINVPASQVGSRAPEIRRMGKLPILYCG